MQLIQVITIGVAPVQTQNVNKRGSLISLVPGPSICKPQAIISHHTTSLVATHSTPAVSKCSSYNSGQGCCGM